MNQNAMDWDGDVTEFETTKIAVAKTAKQMMEELWNVEIEKSTEEAVHDNMHPQRWA